MNNLPGNVDLLAIARETMLAELRPLLPGSARYAVAMIANAMAIAAREIEAGDAAMCAALARLDALYDIPPQTLAGAALIEAVRDRERRLAADIRSGVFDGQGERRREALAHLRASVAARLAVSNPANVQR